MVRDKDEWRRPWVDGSSGLPPRPAAPGGLAASPSALGYRTSDPLGSASGLAASDLAASDLAASDLVASDLVASHAASVQPGASSSVALQPATTSAASRPSGRRPGLLAGIVGGVVGAVLMLGALVALDGSGVIDLGVTRDMAADVPGGAGAPDTAPLPPSTGGPLETGIPDMADRVLPTVVRINVSGSTNLTESNALGSGVIYRSDGYIITNHHVIENAAAVEVLLANGDRLEAEIVGSDPLNDLAVLRIARDGLPVIDLRPNEERLRVGETVVAIGSPFGLDATVTSGIISALNRDLRVPGSNDVIPAVIQTDAAINPGNSGGALVDLQGRLVGINTAIMSRSGANQGVGFAVTVRQAVTSSDQLIEQGFVRYPLLGITGTDVTPQIAELYGLANRRGAVVDSVAEGSGAAQAGMRTGDVIVAVDDAELRSMADLVAEVRRRTPGETVTFDVLRDGQRLSIDVVLGERPRT